MQELAHAISRAMASDMGPIEGAELLRASSIRWATHSLETYQGDLLGRALEISRVVAEFCNWFDSEDQAKAGR